MQHGFALFRRSLEELDLGVTGTVLRAKGIVPSEDGGWLHFDYVPGESEIREGIAKELARIEGYRQAFIDFNGYLESGVVELQETTLYLQNSATGEKLEKTGKFSINLCPDERMEDLKNDVYYYKTVKDEETEEEKKVPTAENVNLVLFDFGDAASDYNRWEGLSFVNYLIQTNLKTGE